MNPLKPSSPSLADLAEGQITIVIARWLLAVAGLFIILLDPGALNAVRFQIFIILGLAMSNFYLTAQILTKKVALKKVIYGASLADLIVITLIVISQGGFRSDTFVFYFPALMAMSLAFATEVFYTFLACTVMGYALVTITTIPLAHANDDFQVLVVRLMMLAAIGVCGNMYQRLQTERLAPSQVIETKD